MFKKWGGVMINRSLWCCVGGKIRYCYNIVLIPLVIAILACFAIPQNAYGSSVYTLLTVPTLTPSKSGQALGIIMVEVYDCNVITNTDALTISFPREIQIGPPGPVSISGNRTAATEEIIVPSMARGDPNALSSTSMTATISESKRTLDLLFNGTFSAAGPSNPGRFLIYISNANIGAIDGDIRAQINAPSGSSFPSSSLIVAKVIPIGNTFSFVQSYKRLGGESGFIDSIVITEESPYIFQPGTVIDLVLPTGFKWDTDSVNNDTISIIGGWGLSGSGNAGAALQSPGTITKQWYTASCPTPTTLRISLSEDFMPTSSNTTASRIKIGNANAYAKVICLEQKRPADASILVTSPNNEHVTEQELVVASFVDDILINAELSDLQVDGLTVTGFDAKTFNYSINVPYNVTSIPQVTATTSNANASTTIFQARDLDGTESERTATIVVKSQDGTVTQNYKVVFSRSDNPQPPENSDCFIATAAYGSYLEPHVQVLRQFRDNVLLHSSIGRWFVNEYYRYSPPIAQYIAHHYTLKLCTRIILTPVIFFITSPTIGWIGLVLLLLILLQKHIRYTKQNTTL